jgi:hypothetical protein
MFPLDSLPETQAALALSIFFATFVYEDGATLLAATLSASGRLDPRIGLLTAFLGIWIGDIGLYGSAHCLDGTPCSGAGCRSTSDPSHSPRLKAGLRGMDRWPWS